MHRDLLLAFAVLCLFSLPALAQPTCSMQVTPSSGIAPLTVTASGLCTSPEHNITEVLLSWGDGTQIFVPQGFTENHTFSSSGTFTVVVTAIDSNGLTGSAQQTVKVLPPLQCSPSASPARGNAPLTVKIAANCTDPNPISSAFVQLGDGYYQNGQTATHTYISGGTFHAVISVKDKAGNVFVGTVDVSVTATSAVFVGINNGEVKEFGKDGSPLATLNTNAGGSTTGMGFDQFANLYVTDFTANGVTRFSGQTPAAFGAGYNCKPESIVFDAAGNAYVGETGCSHAIVKLDPYGTITAVYQPAVEQQGTDWIDLGSDQCTIYYTSQGTSVLRYNACTRQQLAPLTSQLQEGLAVRILPDGGVVVANLQNILRFDGGGKQVQSYDAPDENCWSALALDGDGKSFWASDYCTSDIVRFDLNSGAQLSKFNAGVPTNSVFGVQTFVPPQTTPAGALLASPGTASVTPGQAATYSLAFSPLGSAVGQTFTFSCGNLPVGTSCTFSPPSATAQSGGVNTSLSINTSMGAAASLHRTRGGFVFAMVLPVLPLIFFPILPLSRGKRRLFLIAMLLLFAIVTLSCGGSGSSTPQSSPGSNVSAPPTPSNGAAPSGTYTVLVHAQSGSQESSTTVQLTVQ
ncbi:MAG TPA: PKD domain-containing protein [Terriglobales bacterium]|nr:PKD domain-containing protein [Terriglobales bacterium]